jgi:hypothetical protein
MQSSGTREDERSLLTQVVGGLQQRVPSTWRFELRSLEAQVPFGRRLDALLRVGAPDGRWTDLGVEVKASFYPRDIYGLSSQLGGLWPGDPRPNERRPLPPGLGGMLLVSRFLTERTRTMLREAGFSYADATGNVLIDIATPSMFVALEGARVNPNPPDKTLRSLKGPGVANVVRALIDFRPPYTLRDLASRADLPLGTASRAISYLVDEALVFRDDERGPIERVDWLRLLQRWVRDYSVTSANRAAFFLEPRGLEALRPRLDQLSMPYALTGTLALPDEARVADPALAAVYVANLDTAAQRLELRTVPGAANVVLLEPPDPNFIRRATDWRSPMGAWRLPQVRLSQVAADLMTLPGRGPAEAEALLAWMEGREDVWRNA